MLAAIRCENGDERRGDDVLRLRSLRGSIRSSSGGNSGAKGGRLAATDCDDEFLEKEMLAAGWRSLRRGVMRADAEVDSCEGTLPFCGGGGAGG